MNDFRCSRSRPRSTARLLFPFVLVSMLLSSRAVCAQDETRSATASAVLFRDVRVFDGTSDQLTDSTLVLVQDDRIRQIGREALDRPTDTIVIDGGGRVLMPGLIDLHCHPMLAAKVEVSSEPREYLVFRAAKAMEAALMRGFTTIRDAGGTHYGFARAANEGLFVSPRILHSGAMLSQTAGHGDFRRRIESHPAWGASAAARNLNGMSVLADGVAEVRRAVRENLRYGATQIKIMAGGGGSSPYDHLNTTQYSDDEIRAAVQAAQDWGTYVLAHAYTGPAIERCVKNGVRCIEHANLISDEAAQLIAETQKTDTPVYVVPTLVTYWAISEDAAALDLGTTEKAKLSTLRDMSLIGLRKLKAAGVRVGFGTDLLGDHMVHQSREFRERSNVYTPIEILQQATSISGEVLAMSGEDVGPKGRLGVVSEGALADLLLVDGNPLDDIELLMNVDNILVIMKNGQIYKNTVVEGVSKP